ncbi:MAG: glycosyltransferase family 4 protein [Caldilineaceae bacterium]|nr:glycosyltransferase family 4 protein [Caldilineaceae bacterium]
MKKTIQVVGNARYGGATYLMLEWCKYLLPRGFAVDVLSTDPEMGQELAKIAGVNVIDSIFIPREITPLTDLRAFRQMVALFRRNRYDVVHTYTATPSFLARLAATLVRTPVVVNHQGGWTVNEFSPLSERLLYTPLEYIGVLACTRNICVSHAEAQRGIDMHLAPKHKLVTIVNGMEPAPFLAATGNGAGRKLRSELGLGERDILVGSTGRLVPGKGIETMLAALAKLRSSTLDGRFKLVLAGDGRERATYEALADSLGVGEAVYFLGFRHDIPAFLAGIDIFVTASLAEGLSIALLEAMAAQCPIVSTSIAPNAELIEHEATGLLVPVNDPDGLADAIRRFVSEPDLAQRCAANARQRVLEEYTLDRMFQETWDLYSTLLAAHPS